MNFYITIPILQLFTLGSFIPTYIDLNNKDAAQKKFNF